MIHRTLLASVGIAAMLAFAGPATADDIAFTSNQSYPESFTFSARQDLFLVGSVRHGGVPRSTERAAISRSSPTTG